MAPLSGYRNDYLLEKLPAANVAATRGLEWYSQYAPVTFFIRNIVPNTNIAVEHRLPIQEHFRRSSKAFFVTMEYVLVHQVPSCFKTICLSIANTI